MVVGIEVFNGHYEVYLFRDYGSELVERFTSLAAAEKCVELIKKDLEKKEKENERNQGVRR